MTFTKNYLYSVRDKKPRHLTWSYAKSVKIFGSDLDSAMDHMLSSMTKLFQNGYRTIDTKYDDSVIHIFMQNERGHEKCVSIESWNVAEV